MPRFVLLAGLPGSGKSTVARTLKGEGYFVVEADRLRLALNAGVYPHEAGGEYETLEPVVQELARLAVQRLLERGCDVAFDATNLSRKRRARWRHFAKSVADDVSVEIRWCAGKWDSAKRWAEERGYTEAEWRAVRAKLEPTVEEPTADEADALRVYHR